MKKNIYKKAVILTVLVTILLAVFSSPVFAKQKYITKEIELENIISLVWTISIGLTVKDMPSDKKQDVNSMDTLKTGLLEIYAPESVIETVVSIKKDTPGAYKVAFLKKLQTLKVNKRSYATLFVSKGQLIQIALEGLGKINVEGEFSKDSADIVLNGVGNITINDISGTKNVKISNKGTGKISVSNINNIENVTLVNKGIGRVSIMKADAIKNFKITQEGTGKIEGVVADNITINFSAAGSLYVEAKKELIIKQLDGLGTIFYRGGASPQIRDAKGMSRIKPW